MEQELELAKEKFDFPIERVPLFAKYGGKQFGTEKDCIIRTDTEEVIGYVSAENVKVLDDDGKTVNKNKNYYKIIEHKELVDNARGVINTLGLESVEDSVLTNNGARLYHTFNFPKEVIEIPRTDVKVGDFVNMRITLTNSYDLSRRAGFEVGGIRKVCTNGLMLFKTAFFYLYKHTGAFELDKAIQELEKGIKTFQIDMRKQMGELATTEISTEEGKVLIDELVKKKVVPEKYGLAARSVWDNPDNANNIVPVYDDQGKVIPEEYQSGILLNPDLDRARNLWTFYNAFTLILTHMVVSHERRILMYGAIQSKIQEFIKHKKQVAKIIPIGHSGFEGN
jgi:hypothetical protein